MMAPDERFNTISHGCGGLLAAAGTFLLVSGPLGEGRPGKALILGLYGVSLVLMYLASLLFHGARRVHWRLRFRRLDRTAIYLLMVGVYAPLALVRLPPRLGWPLLAAAVSLALVGTVRELRAPLSRPPRSVALYLLLGWMALLVVKPLASSIPATGLALFLAGGAIYTLGAVLVRYEPLPRSHEIWHVAVLAGSGCHFLMMLWYVS